MRKNWCIFILFLLLYSSSVLSNEKNYEFVSFEGKKEGSQALGLVLNIHSVNEFLASFREVKQRILLFKNKYDEKASFITLTVVLNKPDLVQVKQIMDKIYYQEEQLAPILQNLKFNVGYLDYDENVIEEINYK